MSKTAKLSVFYAWQADLPGSTNRNFIEQCLKAAIAEAQKSFTGGEIVIDKDTRGVPGSPDIIATIIKKILVARVFVADITTINGRSTKRKTPNPNVVFELGFALRALEESRLVCVFNTAFGAFPDDLPFDLGKRRMMTYHLPENSTNKPEVKKRLITQLVAGITEAVKLPPSKYALSSEELKKAKVKEKQDKGTIRRVFETINVKEMDRFIDQAAVGVLWQDLFHYRHKFEACVNASSFHLHDERLRELVRKLDICWDESLSYGHRFDAISFSPTRYKFKVSPSDPQSSLDYDRFVEAVQGVYSNLKELVAYTKDLFPDIDVRETSRSAFDAVKDSIAEDRSPDGNK